MKKWYILLLTLFITGCASQPPETPVPPAIETEAQAIPAAAQERLEAAIGDDDPMTRALAAKMLAAAYNDLNTINTMDRVIEFNDTAREMWYDKYINAVYSGGIMHGDDKGFSPEGYIILSQAQVLLDRLDSQKSIQLNITEETKDKPVSYALWLELYGKLLQNLSGEKSVYDVFGVQERSLVVLATPANNSKLNQWSVVTDKGPYACVGLNLDNYIDKGIKVYLKDGDIIAVLAVESLTPKISNAYVAAVDDREIVIFSGGAERRYTSQNNSAQAGDICDIVINGSEAQSVVSFTETVRAEILLTTTERIEFRNRETLEIGADFKVYDSTGEHVRWKSLRDIVVGTSGIDIFIRDGKACAAVIRENASPEKLRVAISTGGYSGLYHESVSLSGTKAFTVTIGDQTESYDGWAEFKVTEDMFEKSPRVYVKVSDSGRIVLMGVKRAWPEGESPKYRGEFEVYKDPKGYIIVNTVSMEDYLYAVIPSEMPSSYGVEASKAQAITARSYGYNQFHANRYHAYGANIDDSVSCQVYNNIPENDTSIQAADETRGQVLTYKGEVVSANFFSTSSGYTANSGEVWAHSVTKQFPTSTPEYLRSGKQFDGDGYGNLSDEETAARFFKDLSVSAYDSEISWFRWNVEMTAKEIEATINAGIRGRYEANPMLIKTLQEDGAYRSTPINTIGRLKDLEILSRGAGGNIMQMRITGTEATVILNTEYNIRALIKPVQLLEGGKPIILRRKDGTELRDYNIMPSAFYTMDKVYDDGDLVSVLFTGGGNGHGAGMSQNGVKGMIEKGFTVSEVLGHFYNGTEITKMY